MPTARGVFICVVLMATAFATLNAVDPPRVGLQRFTFEEPHMGTLFRIVLYARDADSASKAARAAFDRIAELDRIMSDYKDDSELMLLCKKAGGPPVPVSADLFQILNDSETIARDSDGAFDVTIGPAVRMWRRARRTREMPAEKEIAKALAVVGHNQVRLDPKTHTVQLLKVGIQLDLGGIAKGFAADAALAVLRRLGIVHALVAAGGDIATGEPPPEAPAWKVGVAPLKNPAAEPTAYLMLKNRAVSTSGDAEQHVEIKGQRYSHIVDPKTGLGLVGRRSVTIVAPTGSRADGWATAFCVLGKERSLKILETQKDLAALLVFETPQGIETTSTKGFDALRWR